MKIGFSTLVCPNWDLATIVSKASEYGFNGVELRGVRGELALTEIPEVAGDPARTRSMFTDANVELVCLGTSCTLSSRHRKKAALERAELAENIELASRLRCPYVRVFVGDVQGGEARESTLSRVAGELIRMAPFAAEHKVTVLVQNAGDFSGSADLWYLCDCASHPAIRACWDACSAMTVPERPTTSIPRLGRKIGLMHVCDGEFDGSGFMAGGYKLPGSGNVGWDRAIELLKGVMYQDYLIFEWPKLWDRSLGCPDAVLPEVATYLRQRVEEEQAILTAYKGDKKAPVFRSLPPRATTRSE